MTKQTHLTVLRADLQTGGAIRATPGCATRRERKDSRSFLTNGADRTRALMSTQCDVSEHCNRFARRPHFIIFLFPQSRSTAIENLHNAHNDTRSYVVRALLVDVQKLLEARCA